MLRGIKSILRGAKAPPGPPEINKPYNSVDIVWDTSVVEVRPLILDCIWEYCHVCDWFTVCK